MIAQAGGWDVSGGPGTDQNAPDPSGALHGIVTDGPGSGLPDLEAPQHIDQEGCKPALAAALGPSAWEDATQHGGSQHGGSGLSISLLMNDTQQPRQVQIQHGESGVTGTTVSLSPASIPAGSLPHILTQHATAIHAWPVSNEWGSTMTTVPQSEQQPSHQAGGGGCAMLLEESSQALLYGSESLVAYSAPCATPAGSTTPAVLGDLGTAASSALASGTGVHLSHTTAAVQLPMPMLSTGGTVTSQLFSNTTPGTGMPSGPQQLDPNIPASQPAAVQHIHSRKRKQHVTTPAPAGSSGALAAVATAAEKRARPTTRSINGIRVPPVPLSPPAPQVQAPRRRTITDQKAADILIDIARNNISQVPGRGGAGGPASGRSAAAGRGGGSAALAGMGRGRRTTVEVDIPPPVTAEAAREGRVNIGGERDMLFLALRKHLPRATGNVHISQMTVTNHVLKVVCTSSIHETCLTKADDSDVVEKLNIAVPATRGPAVELPTFGLASGNREGMMLVMMLSCYVPTGALHTHHVYSTGCFALMHCACNPSVSVCLCTCSHACTQCACNCIHCCYVYSARTQMFLVHRLQVAIFACVMMMLPCADRKYFCAANLKKSQADPPQDIRTRVKRDLTAIMGICGRHLPHLSSTPIPTLSSEAATAVAALNYGNELRSYVTLCRLLYAWRVDPIIRPRLDRLTGNPRAMPQRANSAAPMSLTGGAPGANGAAAGDNCEPGMMGARESVSPPAAPATGTPINMSPTHSGNGGNTSVTGGLDNGTTTAMSLDAADGMSAGGSQGNAMVTGLEGNVNPDGTAGPNGSNNGGAGTTVAYDSRKVMLAQLIVDQVREKTSSVTAVQGLSNQVESILSEVGATGTLEGVVSEMEAKVKALQEEMEKMKAVNASVTKELGEGAERDQLHVVLGKLAASTERMSDDVAYLVIGAKTMISERLLRDLFPDVFSG